MNDTPKMNEAMELYAGLISGDISGKIVNEAISEMSTELDTEDNYLKDNNCWSELQALHSSFVVLLRTHASHSVSARNVEVMKRVVNIPLFVTCIKALLKHMQLLSKELSDVYKLHSDLSGGARTHDDVIKSIDLYGMYMLFQDRHEAIIVPTSNILCELVAEAEDKLNEEGLTEVIDEFRTAMHNFINRHKSIVPVVEPEQTQNLPTDVKTKDEE